MSLLTAHQYNAFFDSIAAFFSPPTFRDAKYVVVVVVVVIVAVVAVVVVVEPTAIVATETINDVASAAVAVWVVDRAVSAITKSYV